MYSIQFFIIVAQTGVPVNAVGENFVEGWQGFEILPEVHCKMK
jgi:hypothetical protein